MAEKETKTQYRIRNWSEYNAALKFRGSLTFWVDEEVLKGWLNEQKTGKRGASKTYSDLATREAVAFGTATMSTIGSIFDLPGRQSQGIRSSLFKLMGVELSVPDHSTVSRRLGKLSVSLPIIKRQTARHVVVDSTTKQ